MKLPLAIIIAVSFPVLLFGQSVISPNKKLKIDIVPDHPTNFNVSYKTADSYKIILPITKLGITRQDESFTNDLTLINVTSPRNVHDKYDMLSGKRKSCENFGTERTFSFKNSHDHIIKIIFRAYNDGVAFRYEFPDRSDSLVNITGESTTYTFPNGTKRWLQPYNVAYEDFYPYSEDGKGDKGQQWGFPALFKNNGNDVWMLVSEAGLSADNCATSLSNAVQHDEYTVTYPEGREQFLQKGVMTRLPWASAWHTCIIGSLPDVVASTLITDVSPPNELKNISWIQPGAVSWIYWANNHGSKDYKKVISYIDFAKEMGWPYALIDWEWDVMANGGTVTDAINYARSIGIKPMLWYNSGTSWLEPTPWDRLIKADKRKQEFEWLKKSGVYGIKVDFFAGDQQDMISYYIDILKDAAQYNLMVNFHGATVPRGWSRTYPNLLSTEAVYGAEWYNNLPTMTTAAAAHNTTLPFTRNIVGSMDYTPVTFSNSQHPHITTYGHELALSVVFESGLQHFADTPESYNSLPDEPKDFLKKIPVTWDETRLLDGYPGQKVIIARRKGTQWYIGGLNGRDTTQTLTFNLNALHTNNSNLKIIEDGADDKSFTIKKSRYTKGQDIVINCLPRGGFVAILSK